jgi:hypothetical protein
MSRARCDQFDVAAVRAAIDRGEQSERAAYLTYASTAARPYARSTFSVMLAKQRAPAPKASSLPNVARQIIGANASRSSRASCRSRPVAAFACTPGL